jgi:hypothetical protein
MGEERGGSYIKDEGGDAGTPGVRVWEGVTSRMRGERQACQE